MITQNIYTAMIGKHFKQMEVKLLCALIDQRIQYRLPSYMLRKRLGSLIRTINENTGTKIDKQKKAEIKIQRDLQAYPLSKEEHFNFSVMLKSGLFCKIDLLFDEISYSDVEGRTEITPIQYVTQWKENTYIRCIKPTNKPIKPDEGTVENSPVISIDEITYAHNQAILELLLTVTDFEKGIHEEKTCPSCRYERVTPRPGSFVLASGDTVEPPPRRKYQRRSTVPSIPLQKMVQYQCERCQTVFYM